MSFKKHLKTYFSFSSSERRSMIILLTILIIVFVYPIFINEDQIPIWDRNPEKQKQLDSLLAVLQTKSNVRQDTIKGENLFFFDPNQIDSLGLLSLGFSNYQAKNLLNYRRTGARLSRDIDLKKVYGMTDGLYQQLQPFVQISPERFKRNPKIKKQMKIFDPNKADSVTLISLGFSKFQTRNILTYREKSGRFNTKADLMKIYGIDSSDFERYETYICIEAVQKKSRSHLFSFDPNRISKSAWDSLGVDERVVNRIEKFRAKGGRFKKPEDLKKIYGFDSLKYSKLHAYINIAIEDVDEKIEIELNLADSLQLLSLPGIGPYFAHRIIKYRKKLGGFYSIDQLTDVYGLRKSRVDSISSSLVIDLNYLHPININNATIDDLSVHPYINYREASDIYRFRKRKGRILDLESLRKKKIFQDSTFNRIKPYLSLE